MNEIYIEAKLENVDAVLDFVTRQLEDYPLKIQSQIEIAVDEIFSNIARYAYHPNIGAATVRIAVDNEITIEFEDSGMQYDPLSERDPDITPPVGKRKIGGLGIFMVKNIMDSVEYRREGSKNILTIRKIVAE
ncbi:MAG: ATP-binding protein [Oscillospiraceae bacterium]|nr:ATP-binding protein [Oscillospiraceae bacterium]